MATYTRDMVRVGPLTSEQRQRITTLAFEQGKPNRMIQLDGQYYLPLPLADFQRVVGVQRKGEDLADTLIELLSNGIAQF